VELTAVAVVPVIAQPTYFGGGESVGLPAAGTDEPLRLRVDSVAPGVFVTIETPRREQPSLGEPVIVGAL